MKEILKSIARSAGALTLALLGTAVAVGLYYHAIDYLEELDKEPLETVKVWDFDLSDRIGLTGEVRTKLIDSNLMVLTTVNGYPDFLKKIENENRGLTFYFKDADGFELIKFEIKKNQLTKVVGESDDPIGLSGQITEYVDWKKYQKVESLDVGWNFDVETPKPAPIKSVDKPIKDHCAPKLSKSERLNRLGQHGSIREVGIDEYVAGDKNLSFLPYSSEILNCR